MQMLTIICHIQRKELNSNKEKAAIIGGGDGGVARECISKNFGFIDWYELDPEVVQVCDKHLGKIRMIRYMLI